MDEQEDGQIFRGQIVELIDDHESKVKENPTRIKFRVSVNEYKAEEIITYNKMLEYTTKDEDSDISENFKPLFPMSTRDHNVMSKLSGKMAKFSLCFCSQHWYS
jgi:hypothetical protein